MLTNFILSSFVFLQGSLKEKTVENLEKYVVKDVSIKRGNRFMQ
jgi:hypothetical protein